MDAAEKGRIQILPETFEEDVTFHYYSIGMKYRFSQGDKSPKSGTCYFNTKADLSKDSKRYPGLDVPWVPGGEIGAEGVNHM